MPGPSVLSILTISNVKEMDFGTYDCMMVGNNTVPLTGSAELNPFINVSTNPSATVPTGKHDHCNYDEMKCWRSMYKICTNCESGTVTSYASLNIP